MAVAILLTIAATVGVYRKVVDTGNTTMLIAGISAIGSCASAVASLYVANRTQKLSEIQRETDREETSDKVRKNRQRIAAVYATEIRAWLRRRDLHKFLFELDGLKTKSEILGTIEVSLLARQSNRRVSGPDLSEKDDLRDTIAWQARRSAELLAVSSFAKFRTIPSIWTTLFRREYTEVLGEKTMAFFVSMESVWINLTLATAQIPSAEEVVEFVNGQQPEYAEKYLKKLIDQVFALRELFTVFNATAVQCADALERKGTEDDPLAALPITETLLNGSRDAAFDWSDISRDIQLDESLERWHSKRDDLPNFLGEIKKAQESLEKNEEMAKTFAEEQRRLLNEPPDSTPESSSEPPNDPNHPKS